MKPKWNNWEEKQPEFGEVLFVEDNYGRFAIVKVCEGGDQDGEYLYDFFDQDDTYIDDIEIVRWVLLSDVMPEEGEQCPPPPTLSLTLTTKQ
jgi:hypothetical protein